MLPLHVHRSSSARSGPPNDPPKPAPPKKAPRWLHTMWLAGLAFTALLLFLPSPSKSVTSLSYSDWKTLVGANQVKTATIDPDGKVTGQFVDKKDYESRIPTVLKDDPLAGELSAHNVTVKGKGSSTSFWSVIGGLLPFVVLLGLYLFISRRATRQLSGGIMGFGSSQRGCTTNNARRRVSRMSRATKAPSARSARWSTSCAIPSATRAPVR